MIDPAAPDLRPKRLHELLSEGDELAAALRPPGGSGRSRASHPKWIHQGPVSSLSIDHQVCAFQQG